MKKIVAGALALTLAVVMVGCGFQWVVTPEVPLKNFGSMQFKGSTSTFDRVVKGQKDEDLRREKGQAVHEIVARNLGGFASSFQGTSGGRALTLQAELMDCYAGSGALKFFVGAAANGHIDYDVKLYDGSKLVGHFFLRTEVPVTGASFAAVNASKQMIGIIKQKM